MQRNCRLLLQENKKNVHVFRLWRKKLFFHRHHTYVNVFCIFLFFHLLAIHFTQKYTSSHLYFLSHILYYFCVYFLCFSIWSASKISGVFVVFLWCSIFAVTFMYCNSFALFRLSFSFLRYKSITFHYSQPCFSFEKHLSWRYLNSFELHLLIRCNDLPQQFLELNFSIHN